MAHTKDGALVRVGLNVRCPKGHELTYHPSDPLSGRIYCTKGDCWDSGCQGDSGSGTHYEASEVTSGHIIEPSKETLREWAAIQVDPPDICDD